MGILKHFVLPAFGLAHVASLIACKDLTAFGMMIQAPDPATEKDESSVRQKHMLGCLRGFNLAMLTLCGFGMFSKTSSSDTRQAIAAAETVLFGASAIDAYRLGELNFYVPAVHSLLALAGTIVSYMEPGIFTKDHRH
jgi:hypothetical protein